MSKHIRSLSLVASGLLISSLASAKPVTIKDWSLDDTGASCVAFTSRVVDGQTYRFELTLDKSGVYPVEAWIREVPGTSTTKAFRFTTELKPIQNFVFSPLQDAAGNVSFWQVPSDTASLVSYIKRQTRLLVQGLTPNGAALPISKPVDFSLRGSSDIVDALTNQCSPSKVLTKGEFEKSFVPTQVAQLDPLKLDEAKTTQLRALYQNSVAANAQKVSLQKELTALNTKYAKTIQELNKVTGTLDQLTQKELTALQASKASIEAKIKALDQQLANQQIAINSKEAEVVTANGIYDQAWKVIAPFEPEHKRLNEALQTSRNDLKGSQNRLAEIDQSIQSKSNALSRYESDLNSLRSQLSSAESQVRAARTDVDNTENNYRRFDSRRERDERLREHPILRYCRENRSNNCDSLVRNIENEAEREASTVRIRLSDNYDWARNNLTSKTDIAAQLDSKIRSITQFDIPNTRNQLNDMRNQRPSAENSVLRFRDDVSAKTGALQTYDQSVGYAEKKADLNAKSAVVVARQGELKALEDTKLASVRNREQQAKDLALTDKKIQDVLVKIKETQDRSSELNQALTPYLAEKNRLETGINQAEGLIQANKAEFSTVIIAN